MQSKILKNSINIGGDGEYFYIRNYIPRNKKDTCSSLDEYSELILRYKKGDYKIISFFARLLSNIIYYYFYPYDLILPVPPSSSYLDIYPNSIVCSYLNSAGLIGYLKDEVVCIKGHKPNHITGAKYKKSSISSILIKDKSELKSKNIILFDDIITTGATFRQIKQTLLKKGANSVTGLFLGKTSGEYGKLQGDFNG